MFTCDAARGPRSGADALRANWGRVLGQTIVLVAVGLAVSFPVRSHAQADEGQPPKRSVLGQDQLQAAAKNTWLGKTVIQKYPHINIERGDKVSSPYVIELYVVKEVFKYRLLLRIVGRGDEFWVRADDVVSLDESIDFFTTLIDVRPNDWWGYHMRSACWELQHKLVSALNDINKGIRLCPDVAALYNQRGLVLINMKQYDNSIADFDEAVRIASRNYVAYANRGSAYLQMNNQYKAISDTTESIRLDPLYAPAYEIRGCAWRDKKEYAKAIADFSKAIEIDPYFTQAYAHRAFSLGQTNHLDKALADLKKACDLTEWKEHDLIDGLCAIGLKADVPAADLRKWRDRAEELRAREKRKINR